jgi:hypothetical protein
MQYDSYITLTATGSSYRGNIIKQIKSEEGHNKNSLQFKNYEKAVRFSALI